MFTQTLLLVVSIASIVFSLEYPVGLDPPAPVLLNPLRSYPANVDPSSCPHYPYCHQNVGRQVPTVHYVPLVPLPASAYPTGLDPSLCPNYPFCGDSPPAPVQLNPLRSYPANVDPSSCPNYPYCHQNVAKQEPSVHYVPPVPLPASAYPTGLDPSLCPNYPFCGDSPPAPVLLNPLKNYPANVDASSCPNYPYCSQDLARQVPTVHQVPPVTLPVSA